jgi:hypothetical protein
MTVKAKDFGTLRRTSPSRAGETANAKSRAMAKGTRIGRASLRKTPRTKRTTTPRAILSQRFLSTRPPVPSS